MLLSRQQTANEVFACTFVFWLNGSAKNILQQNFVESPQPLAIFENL